MYTNVVGGLPYEVHGDLSEGLRREPGSKEMQLGKVSTQDTAAIVVLSGMRGMLGETERRGDGEREGGSC